jgi:hypothetical protein
VVAFGVWVFRCGRRAAQIVPGWKYSRVAALEAGASSWTALLDVARIAPGDDEATATANRLRAEGAVSQET